MAVFLDGFICFCLQLILTNLSLSELRVIPGIRCGPSTAGMAWSPGTKSFCCTSTDLGLVDCGLDCDPRRWGSLAKIGFIGETSILYRDSSAAMTLARCSILFPLSALQLESRCSFSWFCFLAAGGCGLGSALGRLGDSSSSTIFNRVAT